MREFSGEAGKQRAAHLSSPLLISDTVNPINRPKLLEEITQVCAINISAFASDAVLSCMFRTENDQNPRIEWKKKVHEDVSFMYYDGHFRGEKAASPSLSPR